MCAGNARSSSYLDLYLVRARDFHLPDDCSVGRGNGAQQPAKKGDGKRARVCGSHGHGGLGSLGRFGRA